MKFEKRNRENEFALELFQTPVFEPRNPVQRKRNAFHDIARGIYQYTQETYTQHQFQHNLPRIFVVFLLQIQFPRNVIQPFCRTETEQKIERNRKRNAEQFHG